MKQINLRIDDSKYLQFKKAVIDYQLTMFSVLEACIDIFLSEQSMLKDVLIYRSHLVMERRKNKQYRKNINKESV